MTELYAKMFGISDQDINEASWLGDWVKRHANSMDYCQMTFRWVWRAA